MQNSLEYFILLLLLTFIFYIGITGLIILITGKSYNPFKFGRMPQTYNFNLWGKGNPFYQTGLSARALGFMEIILGLMYYFLVGTYYELKFILASLFIALLFAIFGYLNVRKYYLTKMQN